MVEILGAVTNYKITFCHLNGPAVWHLLIFRYIQYFYVNNAQQKLFCPFSRVTTLFNFGPILFSLNYTLANVDTILDKQLKRSTKQW